MELYCPCYISIDVAGWYLKHHVSANIQLQSRTVEYNGWELYVLTQERKFDIYLHKDMNI